MTASATSLVLFRIDFSAAGNDTLSLWVDPDVNNLGTAATVSSENWLGASGITSVSVFSYNGLRPLVDNVRLSDDADAFAQVTGVPEPSSAALIALASVAFACGRRRGGK